MKKSNVKKTINPSKKDKPVESMLKIYTAYSRFFGCDVVGILSPDGKTLLDAMKLANSVRDDNDTKLYPSVESLRNILFLFGADKNRIKINLSVSDLILLKSIDDFYDNYAFYTRRLYAYAISIQTIEDIIKAQNTDAKDVDDDESKEAIKTTTEVVDYEDKRAIELVKMG